MMNTYIPYMRICIALVKEALAKGDPPVGSLLVFED
jgi:tRNA(Arg) A34 adenosine deaminase TadA